jgi:hypothetical protein
MTWRWWYTPLVFLVLAAVWTWPAPVSGALLGRRADALGTVWFVSAAARLLPSLHDALTGWPLGADYTRPDSWTLLVVGPLSALLTPTRLVGMVAWLGVTASAWAAEAFARELGARPPWSLVAGLAFSFSGLACTAWIEGYPYHLADPWLPAFGLWWLRALSPEGRAREGAFAAIFFALALATSAWHGLAAALLAVGLLAGARVQGSARAAPVLAAAGGVGLLAGLYAAAFFAHAPASEAASAGAGGMSTLADRLLLHTAPGPAVDIDARGQSAWFSAVMLAGVLAAPVLVGRDWRVRTLGITAAVALALALVPLPWDAITAYAPAARAGAVAALRAAFGRFPERLGWAWLLAGGVVAARALTELGRHAGRRAWPLLLAAGMEPFVVLGLPGRQLASPGEAPAAYAAATGPVLDLWPEDLTRDPGWDLRVGNTDCFYQASHHRPIADLCLLVPGAVSPRARLAAWTTDALFDGDVDGVRTRLAGFGFTTLAWHPDVFRPSDRVRLGVTLAQLDKAPAESTDAGDHVIAYAIPGAAEAPAAAAAWSAWVSG